MGRAPTEEVSAGRQYRYLFAEIGIPQDPSAMFTGTRAASYEQVTTWSPLPAGEGLAAVVATYPIDEARR